MAAISYCLISINPFFCVGIYILQNIIVHMISYDPLGQEPLHPHFTVEIAS